MEAMTVGAPVLAVDLPGNRRLVGEGERGLLVPAGDAHALAAAILRGLATPRAEWQPRLDAAREFVAARLSIAAVAREHAGLYNNLVRG
jgi:glycosyltransferase involved in cell wall biosynthesis